jgi:hypothetical protein
LSEKALKEFGILGKLIKQGKIEEPNEPDRSEVDLSDEFQRMQYIADTKTYLKLKMVQDQKKLKLCVTILKHLSDDRLEAVEKAVDWSEIEESADPEHLWKVVGESIVYIPLVK